MSIVTNLVLHLEVPDTYKLGQQKSWDFMCVFSDTPCKCQDSTLNQATSSSKSFQIHYSVIILFHHTAETSSMAIYILINRT